MSLKQKRILQFYILSAILIASGVRAIAEECTGQQSDPFWNIRKGKCVASCNPDAKTDVAEYKSEDNNYCISCPPSRKFYFNGGCSNCIEHDKTQDEQNGTCIDFSACTGYLSPDKLYCWKNSCKKGTKNPADKTGDYYQCEACGTDSPYSYNSNTECISATNCTQYSGKIDEVNKTCYPADFTCTGYQLGDICYDRCPDGMRQVFTEGGSAVDCEQCQQGQYLDTSNQQCIDECIAPKIIQLSTSQCLQAKEECNILDTQQYLLSDENSCTDECPNGEIPITNGKFSRKCQTCQQDYFILITINPLDNQNESNCLLDCGQGYVGDVETRTCIKPTDCADIIFNNKCYKKCPVNTYQKDQTCTTDCDDLVGDIETNKCIAAESCTKYIYNNLCYQTCPPIAKIADEVAHTCLTAKEQCESPKYLIDGLTCVSSSSCPAENYTFDGDEGILRCNSTCALQDGSSSNSKKCFDECSDGKTFIKGTQSYCNKCPSDYATKEANGSYSCGACSGYKDGDYCVTQCENKIQDEVEKTCYTDKSLCKSPNYLIDDKTCISSCPPENYTFESDTTVKRCNTSCELKDGTDLTSKQCVDLCPGNGKTFSKDNQKYCSKCPSDLAELQQDGNYICQACTKYIDGDYCVAQCEGKIQDNVEKKCYSDKSDCITSKYLIDDKVCVGENDCPSENFTFASDSELPLKRCNTDCTLRDGSSLTSKQCYDSCSGDGKTYTYNGQKYCTKCPKDIAEEDGNGTFTCKSCANYVDNNLCVANCGTKITDEVDRKCLNNQSECESPKYLVNLTKCELTCPSENYTFDSDTTLKRCNTQCEFKDGQNPNSKKCFDACPNNGKYYENNSQKYCTQCPADYPVHTVDGNGNYTCASCTNYYDVATNTCILKEECVGYFTEDKRCITKCDLFEIADENTSYKTCLTECPDPKYYKVIIDETTNHKYCNSCPNSHKYAIDGNDYVTCASSCTLPLIPHNQDNTCIEKTECKEVLINDAACDSECTEGFYTYDSDVDAEVKRCDSSCSKIDGSNIDSKKCFDTCTNSTTYSFENQVYCNQCPSNIAYKTKTAEKTYTCSVACKNEDITDSKNKECFSSKDGCVNRYIKENTCVDECTDSLLPDEGEVYISCVVCTGSKYEVTVQSKTVSYCNSCPSTFEFKEKKGSTNDFTCLEDCGDKYPDDNGLCVTKEECSGYLVDDEKCSTCPEGYYKYQADAKKCTENCEFLDGSNPQSLECNLTCSIYYSVIVGNVTTNHCNQCPDSHPFKTKVDDTNYTCSDECDTNKIVRTSTKECILLEDCKNYLTDEKSCDLTCLLFSYENEKTEYKRCDTTCDHKDGSAEDSKLCYFECVGAEYKVTIDGTQQIYCNQCPDSHGIKTEVIADKEYSCSNECSGDQIYDSDNIVCLENKLKCIDRFFIDDATCDDECPSDHFTYPENPDLVYKLCTKECEFLPGQNPNSKECSNSCSTYYTVTTDDITQKYCSQCPSDHPYKTEDENGNYTCSTQCVGDYVLQTKNKECILMDNCQEILIDNKTCESTCPSTHYHYENEQTSYTRCDSECPLKSGSNESSKLCFEDCSDSQYYIVQQESGHQSYCEQCPVSNKYKIFESQNDYLCVSVCPEGTIIDNDNNECLATSSECADGRYLFQDKFCQNKCDFFEDHKSDGPYKVCVKECEFFAGDVENPKQCVPTCSQTFSVQSENKTQKFCKQCPKGLYEEVLTSTTSKCVSKCSDAQIISEIDSSLKCLKTKDECENNYLVDDKKCLKECPSNYFQYELETTKYKRCTSTFICNGSAFKDLETKKNYCNICPDDLPYTVQISSTEHKCVAECSEGQILDIENNACLSKKEDCKAFLINEKECSSECDLYQYKNETTPYKKCHTKCQDGYTTDTDEMLCYAQKSECTKFISNNGKECVSSCEGDTEYAETVNDIKQCKACRKVIKETTDKNNLKTITCVDKCDQDQMIFVFGDSYEFQKCVAKDFCEDMLTQATDTNKCSNICLSPDVLVEGECATKCPNGYQYQISNNSCQKGCGTTLYLTSDSSICVPSCDDVFEVIDESIKDKKQCKKCDATSIFGFDDKKKGICKTIVKTEEGQKEIKSSLLDSLITKETIVSTQEAQQVSATITVFSKSIEESLSTIAGKAEKTAQDQTKAKAALDDLLEVTKSFLSIINTAFVKKPVQFGDSQLKVTGQTTQPGKKFKKSFNSAQVSSGTITELLENNDNEASTEFDPKFLQIAYVKNNHFCTGAECKNAPPIFTVNYELKTSRRILQSTAPQFTMVHIVPEGLNPKQQQCLSYDASGKMTTSQGIVSGNQITCSFSSSSALYNDSTCQYVEKSLCQLTPIKTEETEDSDSDELSGGAIAGIVLGIFTAIGLVAVVTLHYFRQKKLAKERLYKDNNERVDTENNQLNNNANNFQTQADADYQKTNRPILKLQ